ncbi:hypothetical protein [Flavobacterium sp.]|uniref:hypothetical protein n=1 Tax=Flavobacterium sp. TaxID=239 RepID=UPI003750EEA0
MNKLAIILLMLFLFGCLENKKNPEKQKLNESFYGNELIENEFLKFANQENTDSLKIEIIESFNIYNEGNFKIVSIDAEELAEFNFKSFVPNLNKILSKRKIQLDVETAENYESSNDILINQEKIKLYSNKEMNDDTFWDAASRNFFKKVNEIILKSSLPEKFYLLYEGNDLSVMLLTEKQYKIIAEKYKNEAKEIPYLP